MAQKFDGVQDGPRGSKTDAGVWAGVVKERRSTPHSFWNYPEKVRSIAWSRTMRKKARGLEGADLGKVQAVESRYVRTAKGFIRKEIFHIPRELAQAFDGSTLWFGVEPGLENEFLKSANPGQRTGVQRLT